MGVYSEEIVQEARRLRREDLSYREIAKRLKVRDNLIGKWCFGIKAGRGYSLREIKRHEELRKRITKKEEKFAKGKVKKIGKNEAKLLAALLYWCEGAKYPTTSRVDFVNSDERMMKTFICLLRKGFNIDENKFRVHLQIHETHDFVKLRDYWGKLLGISNKQFLKPTVTKPTGRRYRQNYKGTCTLRYYNYRVALKLIRIYKTLALNIKEI